jgi:hypothetical protein
VRGAAARHKTQAHMHELVDARRHPCRISWGTCRSSQQGFRSTATTPSSCAPPSGAAHLQITNAATVKKMMKSKKQRKLLKTADTN